MRISRPLALALALCGTGCAKKQSLQVVLNTSPDIKDDPFNSVTQFNYTLQAPDVPTAFEHLQDRGDDTPIAAALPVVDGLRLSVRGVDLNGNVLALGESAPLKASAGGTVQAPMYFGRTFRFSSTVVAPAEARFAGTTTLLPDGRALLVGGGSSGTWQRPTNLSTVIEVYDPTTGQFCGVGGGVGCPADDLLVARALHTATLTAEGDVFIAGGWDGKQAMKETLIYSPVTGSYTQGPDLLEPRYGHTATLIDCHGMCTEDHNLLIAGGYIDAKGTLATTNYLYDTMSATFTKITAGDGLPPRAFHVATALNDQPGEILLTGGIDETGDTPADGNVVYQPTQTHGFVKLTVTDPFLRSKMLTGRVGHTATVIDGQYNVLIFGGLTITGGVVDNATVPEVFVLSSGPVGAFSDVCDSGGTSGACPTGSTRPIARAFHAAFRIGNSVLLAGGETAMGAPVLQVQRFDPASDNPPLPSATDTGYDATTLTYTDGAKLPSGRSQGFATVLGDNTALLAGGATGATRMATPGALEYVHCSATQSSRLLCPIKP